MLSFLAFGAGLSFLMALANWFSGFRESPHKNRSSDSFGKIGNLRFDPVPWLFLSVSIVLCHLYLELSDSIRVLPWIYGMHIPFLFWIGPLNYMYFRVLSGQGLGRFGTLHFLPPVLAISVLSPFFFSSSEIKLKFIESPSDSQFHFILLCLLILGTLSNFIYPSLLLRRIWGWSSKSEEKNRSAFYPFLFLYSFTILVLLLFVIAQIFFMPLFPIAGAALSLLVCAIFLVGAANPDLLSRFRTESREASYSETRIKGLDLDSILSRMEILMRERRMFLNEDLTLAGLAAELGIGSHQLSEILNTKIRKSFREYLTEFRLEEAASLLLSEPQRSVLSVLYSSGFNSKSAFHKLFQERYGLTPTEYRSRS